MSTNDDILYRKKQQKNTFKFGSNIVVVMALRY